MRTIGMRMAKATEADLDAIGKLMKMIELLLAGDMPRIENDGSVESIADFDDEDGEECIQALSKMLMLLQDNPGAFMRVFAMAYMANSNEVFDPDKDHLSWHPDLVDAVNARQRRRAIEKAQAEPLKIIDWELRERCRFSHEFCGYVARHYATGCPEQGWVLAYDGGGGDRTFPIVPPEPDMEPVRLSNGQGEFLWCWVKF